MPLSYVLCELFEQFIRLSIPARQPFTEFRKATSGTPTGRSNSPNVLNRFGFLRNIVTLNVVEVPIEMRKVKPTRLDPWPVVSTAIFDLASSDEVISIVGNAGLTVDWSLTPKEAFSHTTRKRAYLPKVHAIYSTLPLGDQTSVLCAMAADLVNRHPEKAGALASALKRVGWALKFLEKTENRAENNNTLMKRDRGLQKLLLLQLRDGGAPSGLEKFSEAEQVYNSALLIEDEYVNGEAIRGGDGRFVTAVMTELTSKGHDFLEGGGEEIQQERGRSADGSPDTSPLLDERISGKVSKVIFVSHSSGDTELAEALVDMLCTAFALRFSDFICTSVDGAKLQGGAQTDDVLRQAIRQVPAFLSLLTPGALSSTYVLFELGARWGNEKHHIPLLAKGAGAAVLKEPLKATNALNLSSENEVLQLVTDLASVIKRSPEPPNAYLKKARKIMQLSLAGAKKAAIERVEKRAIEILGRCVELMEASPTLESALLQIGTFQASLVSGVEQVSVVRHDKIVLHARKDVEGLAIARLWEDQMSGNQSLYPAMRAEGRGLKLARIVGINDRLTAIAFQVVHRLDCMVVAEAHYSECETAK